MRKLTPFTNPTPVGFAAVVSLAHAAGYRPGATAARLITLDTPLEHFVNGAGGVGQ